MGGLAGRIAIVSSSILSYSPSRPHAHQHFSLTTKNVVHTSQALAAYRTASRLFPGAHQPWLFLGQEYVRTSGLAMASQCLKMGLGICPNDAFILNELGVLAYHRKQFR